MKQVFPSCNILGVNISAVDMETTVSYLRNHVNELRGDYICVSNVHTTVMSYEDSDYCKIQNNAVMVLPDGGPLSVVGKRLGYKNMRRVTGPDLMEELFKKTTAKKQYRHFFYGSTIDTLKKIKDQLEKKYPAIEIAGMYSPPFHEITVKEDNEIVNVINKSKPDFIWVGLGAPKQERWMAQHQGKVYGLMIGVGAGFDYHAGKIKRAPKWMQRNNLEWLYRMFQDPFRLFSRYLRTNLIFLFLIGKSIFIKRKR